MHYLFLLFICLFSNITSGSNKKNNKIKASQKKSEIKKKQISSTPIDKEKEERFLRLLNVATPKVQSSTGYDLQKKEFYSKPMYAMSDPLSQYILKQMCDGEFGEDYKKLFCIYGRNLSENKIQKVFFEALKKCNSSDQNLIEEGMNVLYQLAAKGFPFAIYKLALIKFKLAEFENAYQLLSVPQLAKYPPALFLRAYIHYLENDSKNAFLCAQDAGDYVPAVYLLAQMYTIDDDIKNAKTKLRYCAEKGFALAKNDLAVLLDRTGSKDEKKEATELFRQLADQNNPYAYYNLATSYESGDGVQKDQELAVEYYYKALNSDLDQQQRSKIYHILKELAAQDDELAKIYLIDYYSKNNMSLDDELDWLVDIFAKYFIENKEKIKEIIRIKIINKLKEIDIISILKKYNSTQSKYLLAFLYVYGPIELCEINISVAREYLNECALNKYAPAFAFLAKIYLQKNKAADPSLLNYKLAMECFRQCYILGIHSPNLEFNAAAKVSLANLRLNSLNEHDECKIEHFYAKCNLTLLMMTSDTNEDFETKLKIIGANLYDIGSFIKNCKKIEHHVECRKYLEELSFANFLDLFIDIHIDKIEKNSEVIQQFLQHVFMFFAKILDFDRSYKYKEMATDSGSYLPKLLEAKTILKGEYLDVELEKECHKKAFDNVIEIFNSKTNVEYRAQAAYLLYHLYNGSSPRVVVPDESVALEYLRFAALHNISASRVDYAMKKILSASSKVEAKNLLKVIHDFADDENLAKGIRREACFSLATTYYRGIVRPFFNEEKKENYIETCLKPNIKKAKRYCFLAKELEEVRAFHLLGNMYQDGHFPEEKNSLEIAAKYLENAVGCGLKYAKFDLAEVYGRLGKMVEAYSLYKNIYEFLKDQKVRIKEKFPESRMALMHLKGIGVEKKDIVQALGWTIKALENGAIRNGEINDPLIATVFPLICHYVISDLEKEEPGKKAIIQAFVKKFQTALFNGGFSIKYEKNEEGHTVVDLVPNSLENTEKKTNEI
ncbi:sel1 repeat family protein [Candidatus Dependentiae bacterium]|nr:sel1 repeat family protein [Candidatus Dependentiae bacterium]